MSMKKSRLLIVLAFLLLCMTGMSIRVEQHTSDAAVAGVHGTSPVPWTVIASKNPGDMFIHNNLWVYVEDSANKRTGNIFTGHALRDGDDLVLDYWSYTFDLTTDKKVIDYLNSIMVPGYFSGKASVNTQYIPPSSILNLYSDDEAKEKGLPTFKQGHIGIVFGDETGYALPWNKGVVTFGANNPGQ